MSDNVRSRPKAPVKKTVAKRPVRPPTPPAWDPEPIYHQLVDELHFDPAQVTWSL